MIAIHALDDVVAVTERTAGVGARAHRHGPLRIGHLVVDALEHRRHLDASRCRRRSSGPSAAARPTAPCPRRSTSKRDANGRHHLDRAAGEAERHRPHRRLARPVEEAVGDGRDARTRRESCGCPRSPARRAPSACRRSRDGAGGSVSHSCRSLTSFQSGTRNLGNGRLYFHSRIPSR